MRFLQTLTFVLLPWCSSVQERSRLKLPQLPLVSEPLQEAEDCRLLAQGFANCQARDGFVILICVCKDPLLLSRLPYLLLCLFLLSYFSSLCFTTYLSHGQWMSEWKSTDSCLHSACEKKGQTPSRTQEKAYSKTFRWLNTSKWGNLHLLLSN